MKLRTTCLLLILFQVIGSVGATEIPAGPVSGDWYSSGNPYNVNGDIYVDAGNTLNVHEGVEVIFHGYFKFNVYGLLEAVGTAGDSILFTAADTVTGWGGMRFLNSVGNSDLTYCSIEHGHASGTYPSTDRNGGGIYCYNSNLTITNCSFYSNSASSDMYAYGGALYIESCQPEVFQCRFIGNNVSGNWARGGGIACVSASPTIEECSLSDNFGEYSSGGIHLGSGSSPIIANCTISQNSADNSGGGVGIVSTAMPVISGCTIWENTAGLYGGGIACDSASNAAIEDCAVVGNTAPSYGGGIYCGEDSNPAISGNTIDGNTAAKGGGIYCNYSSPVIFDNLVIQNQTNSGYGGGIYCNFSDPVIMDNTIWSNVAVFGGGIRCWVSSPIIIGNTITENWATYGGGINSGGGTPEVVNCIIWGNSMDQITEGLDITYSDIQGGWPGTGNIDSDPLFAGIDYRDYRLQWRSPCIDAGNPDPIYNDPDNTVADMGAWYYDQSIAVRVLLTPHEPSIQIPASGGAFDYTIQVTNIGESALPVNAWCDVILPNGSVYGPVLGPFDLNIGSEVTLSRERTQAVPSGAPPGVYSYNAYAVTGSDTSFDNFSFVKLESGGSDWYSEWFNTGESFGESYPVATGNLPDKFEFYQPFPNPFNQRVALDFALPAAAPVKLTVYDIAGREVGKLVDGYQSAGDHEVIFDAKDLVSGVYFVRLTVDSGQSMVRKVVLMK